MDLSSPSHPSNRVLLEGLFELMAAGDTDSAAFAHLQAEVYQRLYATYAEPPAAANDGG